MSEHAISTGGCHCGSVRFEARLTDGLERPRRCTCSYCRMKGAVMVSAAVGELTVTQGKDLLTEYRFNTGAARHYFCSRCGIHTHHRRRSNPNQFGVNVACLDGVSPFDFAEVLVNDGVSHPADQPAGSPPRIAGILRYEVNADD